MRIVYTSFIIFCAGFPGLMETHANPKDPMEDPDWNEPLDVHGRLVPESTRSTPYAYPFLVHFLQDTNDFKGQGVILDPYTIITCGRLGPVGTVTGENYRMLVIAGSPDWTSKDHPHMQTREVCSAVRHPKYNHSEISDSYQLIHLCDPFVFNNYVKAIQLAPPGYKSIGECIMVAYGRLYVGGPNAGFQHEMRATEVDISQCRSNSPTAICTTNGFCDWDDGGPLICNSGSKTYLYGVLTPREREPPGVRCGGDSAFASMPNMDSGWFRNEIEKAKSSPCANITTNSGPSNRISNGETPQPHSYPFIVVFKIYHSSKGVFNVYKCFGVIIDAAAIITTSKCTVEIQREELRRIRVQVGNHDLREREKSQQTRHICRLKSIGDFTVVHLSDPFVFNEYVKPIRLVNPKLPEETSLQKCVVAGWGTGNTAGSSSTDAFTILRHREVEILPSSNWTGSPYNLTAAVVTSQGLCNQDFGAPLVCAANGREYVLGLGEAEDSGNCANNKASLFISLASLDRNKLAQEMIDGATECRPVPQEAAGL